MPSLPRIITVDPTGRISQQVKNAVDLMDRAILQIVAPSGLDALEEVRRAGCNAVISAWSPGGMPGWELAAKVKQISGEIPVILIAEVTEPELDDEMRATSPFLYLHRPFELAQFLRVLTAALDGEDVQVAMKEPEQAAVGGVVANVDYGPVPSINRDKAQQITHQVMIDVQAGAALLCTRNGDVIVEQGVVGYMNRDELAHEMVPSFMTGVALKDMVGGNLTELQFFDGDEYDVYMISVGFHYFMILVFDGQAGARALGMVSRLGRRGAEDLIALMGAEAWIIRKVEIEKKTTTAPRLSEMEVQSQKKATSEQSVIDITVLEKAEIPEYVPEPSLQLDVIADEDFNIDDIFGDDVSSDMADDMFDMDNMEKLAQDDPSSRRNTVTWDDAERLGLLGKSGSD